MDARIKFARLRLCLGCIYASSGWIRCLRLLAYI